MFLACQSPRIPRMYCMRLGLALDEHRVVADGLLLLVDRAHLRVHDLRADLHVADRVVAVGLRVAFPDRDRMRHQLAHRRLEIVVAHDAAGDARGAGADAGLVEHDDAAAAGADRHAASLQLLREMHRRRQAVDAGADDDVAGVGGQCSHGAGPQVRIATSIIADRRRRTATKATPPVPHATLRRSRNGSA
jgi:hypothetical protein